MSKKNETKPLKQRAVRRSVTITIPLHIAETLDGLIDGCLGSSEDELFTEQMTIVLRKIEKGIAKHYT